MSLVMFSVRSWTNGRALRASLLDLRSSEVEPGRELFRYRDILEPHVARQSVAEQREILAAHQRRQIAPGLGGDAEAVAGDEIARHLLLDVGDAVERRHADLPAIRLVGDPYDRGPHGILAGEREFHRRL